MTQEEYKKLEHHYKIRFSIDEIGSAYRLNDILSACFLASKAHVGSVRSSFYDNISTLEDDQGTLICDWYSTPTALEMKTIDTFWEIFGGENANHVEHYKLIKHKL